MYWKKSLVLLLCLLSMGSGLISCSEDDNGSETTTAFVKMSLATVQCETPWAGFPGDTLEQKVSNYLNDLGVTLQAFEVRNSDTQVCTACSVCAGPTIVVTVDNIHIPLLEEEGFILKKS